MPPARPFILLAPKLQPPAALRELVPRLALVERLLAPPRRALTLVSAPPGWGKTTIVAEWGAADPRGPFAWVSLDAGDDDPTRFWTYVAHALHEAEPSVGAAALAELERRGADVVGHVLPLLLNELAALEREVVLVLDDLHTVTNPAVHEGLSFLLDHLPPSLELVVATRADPPLPLPRLRARGLLLELRAEDLRFTRAEAEAFLNELLGLGLDADDLGLLQRRTEGWAAALQLAALSLRGRADTRRFLDAFAGDDRHLVDYLGSEVLETQPPEVREFLLRTSILERLSAPLCDAVTGAGDGAQRLDEIERANLFLVPLDPWRQWYRYHHLFGDLLRLELARTEPELIPELHRRASAWLQAHDAVPAAIVHAAEAGDHADAAGLVAANWVDWFNRGRLETVSRWLDRLPRELVRGDGRLALARAWIAVDNGRVAEAGEWLDAAEADGGSRVGAEAAVLRAVEQFKSGDVGGALEAARRALALGVPETPLGLLVARCIHGVALHWRGEADEAEAELGDAAALAERAGNELARTYALGYLALSLADRSDPSADAVAADALGAAETAGGGHFVGMVAHLARARTYLREGRLEDAEGEARPAVSLARGGAGVVETAAALTTLATVLEDRGDREEARALLAEARAALDGCADPGLAADEVARAARRRTMTPELGEDLSERELGVLRLLETSLSLREIGRELYVSLNTVKSHVRAIYRKLDASSRREAVERGRELGLI